MAFMLSLLVEQAEGLIESGLDFVTDVDGMKLLRKMKSEAPAPITLLSYLQEHDRKPRQRPLQEHSPTFGA